MLPRWLFGRLHQEEGAGGGSGGDGGSGSGTGTGDGGQNGGEGTILGRGDNRGGGAGAGGQGSGEGAPGAGDGGEAGAGGDGGQAGEGDGDRGGPDAWFWSDGVAGSGDRPDWFKADKYKSVEEQAKAAGSLESKLGPAAELVGAPEGGSYATPEAPEGVQGAFDEEDPLLVGFRQVAGELNLSQAAHDKIVQAMGQVIAKENTAEQARLSEALAALGENVDARVNAVDTYLINTYGQDAWSALAGAIGNDVNAYKVVEQLVAKASGDAQLAGGTGQGGESLSRETIEAEQWKRYPEGHQLAGQLMYEHDKEHRRKVDDMWKRKYPGEDRQEVALKSS